MNKRLKEILDSQKIMVIDGSMSTALENMGLDLNDSLWTALALWNHPEMVKEVHKNYFRAGADCAISCSYQASIPGFLQRGFELERAEDLIRSSVRLLTEAIDEFMETEAEAGRPRPLALAGVGPYGAYLADGSEYTGNYGVSDAVIRDFHRRRMELLLEMGADLLLVETQPSLKETVIVAELAESYQADYWISFSCRDGKHINEGELISDCASELTGYPHLQMLGVNCVKPVYVTSLIQELKSSADKPIAVYPNSGEKYDASTKSWSGIGFGKSYGEYALEWMENGATAVGGCCRTVESHIREVCEAREKYLSR